MSVQAFLEYQQKIRALLAAPDAPACWAVVANSVYARAEHETIVAVFDTRELAEAYVEASLLPDDLEDRNLDGRQRSFRSDSLLWDYNNTRGGFQPPRVGHRFAIVVEVTNPLVAITTEGGWGELPPPQNPVPPSGPLPPDVFARDAAKRLGADAETAALIE